MYIVVNSVIWPVDDLTDTKKIIFKDNSDANNIKLYRTKCSVITKNILYRQSREILKTNIGDRPIWLFDRKSTDFFVYQILGTIVIYFSQNQQCNV